MPAITLNLPEPPEGFEYTGEYRKPLRGEKFLSSNNVFDTANMNHLVSHGFILRKKKWRGENGNYYFHVNSCGLVCKDTDLRHKCDNLHWKLGNYFSTKEEAQRAANAFKEFFKQFNLGE